MSHHATLPTADIPPAPVISLGPKIAEIRVGNLALNVAGGLLLVLISVAAILLAHALPHFASPQRWHLLILVGSLLALLPVHEGLHAAGLMKFARVPWKKIRFGLIWPWGIAYCHCAIPISIRSYCRMALLPVAVTGLAAIVALLWYPSDVMGFVTGMVLAAGACDVWTVYKLRRFDREMLIQDSATECGGDVFARA